jgi:hypothetical protein
MIIDIIQNFKYHPQSPHFMFEHFGIILDILFSEKIVKFDRAEKTQIVNETVHRLPQKMYMETESVDLSTLLSQIVRDVLFGDVMNENEDMHEIMQIDTPSVTFSSYIDVAELHRQMIIMSRLLREKDIANSNTIKQVVEKLSTKIFLNINCIRRVNTNNKDIEKIRGKHVAEIINESIVYNMCKEICEIGKSDNDNNEFCILWIGICNVYQAQYRGKTQDVRRHIGYCQMVQKMILAKEEMASQIKRHGEIQTLEKVREIVEIVCQVLNKTTDMMNVTLDTAHMRDIMFLCPDITQEKNQTRMKIHFTHAKGIHLLHAKESTQQQHITDILIPARVYEIIENKHNILKTSVYTQCGTKMIVEWQRKNIMVSFLHIIWSLFGVEQK